MGKARAGWLGAGVCIIIFLHAQMCVCKTQTKWFGQRYVYRLCSYMPRHMGK